MNDWGIMIDTRAVCRVKQEAGSTPVTSRAGVQPSTGTATEYLARSIPRGGMAGSLAWLDGFKRCGTVCCLPRVTCTRHGSKYCNKCRGFLLTGQGGSSSVFGDVQV